MPPTSTSTSTAGKSYTMTGSGEQPGLIPRLCSALFERISEQMDATVTVEVSYMEIYNEKVFDLLDLAGDHKTGLKVGLKKEVDIARDCAQVREHNVLGPYVEGLSQLCVLDAQEIEDLMIGEKIKP